jgi:hypothetical protein
LAAGSGSSEYRSLWIPCMIPPKFPLPRFLCMIHCQAPERLQGGGMSQHPHNVYTIAMMLTNERAALVTYDLYLVENEAHAYLKFNHMRGVLWSKGNRQTAVPVPAALFLEQLLPLPLQHAPAAALQLHTLARVPLSLSSTFLPSTSPLPSPPPSHARTLAITRTTTLSPTPSPRSSSSARLSQLSAAVSPCPTSPAAASRARRD